MLVLCFAVSIVPFLRMILYPYLIEMLVTTARGEDELPRWPEISKMSHDVTMPFLMVSIAASVTFMPLLIYIAFQSYTFNDFYRAIMFSEFDWNTIAITMVIIGILYSPMAIITSVMSESIISIFNVYYNVKMVFANFKAYLANIALFYGFVLISIISQALLKEFEWGALFKHPTAFLFSTWEVRILGLYARR